MWKKSQKHGGGEPSRAQPRREESSRPNYAHGLGRRSSRKRIDNLKRKEENHTIAIEEATRLRNRMGNPAAYFPADPEKGFPLEAISVAERGRHRTEESAVFGSTQKRRAIRAFERSAKRYGDTAMEVGRLIGYPLEIQRYIDVTMELRTKFLASSTRSRIPRRDLENRGGNNVKERGSNILRMFEYLIPLPDFLREVVFVVSPNVFRM